MQTSHTLKMNRRSFIKNILKGTLICLAPEFTLTSYVESYVSGTVNENTLQEKNLFEMLMEIYKEVIELGSRDKEPFIKREFFMDLDGNSNNKEEHVVFLNHNVGDKEKVILQVTYFESKRKNSFVKYAKNTREILFYLQGEKIEIKECDYKKNEMKSLLPEILKGIRSKKEILNHLRKKAERREKNDKI